MRKVDPAGFENCRLELVNTLFNCATIEAIPPEKLTPITGLFGFAPKFDSGSASGSSTRTTVTWRWVLVAVSVKAKLLLFPGNTLEISRSNPTSAARAQG